MIIIIKIWEILEKKGSGEFDKIIKVMDLVGHKVKIIFLTIIIFFFK